ESRPAGGSVYGGLYRPALRTAPGIYSAAYGSLELPRIPGPPKVFVIGGGGSGIPAYRRLRRQGIPFAAGILQEHDLDFPAAKALAVDVISSPAFQPMGEGAYTQALAVLKTCETVLCCCPGFGPDNDANRRLLNAAQDGQARCGFRGVSHGL
ncbi:MAG: hypothetical protein ACLUNZ_05600, partial [Evtepia sp.]